MEIEEKMGIYTPFHMHRITTTPFCFALRRYLFRLLFMDGLDFVGYGRTLGDLEMGDLYWRFGWQNVYGEREILCR